MGCNNLANTYSEGAEPDRAHAVALYKKACDLGSGMACSTIAKAFLSGDGVTKDPAMANRYFSRSALILQGQCDQGSPRACGQAGWLYERGLGVEKDTANAAKDYTTGCEANDGASCYNLALGTGRPSADDPTRKSLLAKACSLGLHEACAVIGE
jgi:TPR repeat protein